MTTPAGTELLIAGGNRLQGTVRVSGAKNSALKLLACSLLAPGTTTLENVPDVSDIATMIAVLEAMGVSTERSDHAVSLDVPAELDPVASYELTSRMRASIQVLGPLIARCGHARVAMPGGCNLGSRKLDMHLAALELMGVEFENDHGDLVATAPELHGARIVLEFPSMGATENVLLAAMGTSDEVEIENAAREPEIADLAKMLSAMGAEVEGAGTTSIRMRGTADASPVTQSVIPDRIEAGTYVVAAAMTDGDIRIEGCVPEHLEVFLHKAEQIGVEAGTGDGSITARRAAAGLRCSDVMTLPYPGFPTDLQPQTVAMLCLADGASVVTENVFDGRFQFVNELNRMGADVRTEGRHAVVSGPQHFSGAPVEAPDIRAGAALVCAALCAEGESRVTNVHLIDRGYDDLVAKLRGLGASIERRD